jgi:hypothetical protein
MPENLTPAVVVMMRGMLRCWRSGDGRRTSWREIVLEMKARNLSDETAWSSCTSALLAPIALTTVLAYL